LDTVDNLPLAQAAQAIDATMARAKTGKVVGFYL
jgi:hypothetical protein